MGSHAYLALQDPARPAPAALPEYLAGAVAPDVRYVQANLPRERTHSWELGERLAGPFGQGYRHHLAVDQAFYRRCEQDPLLSRIGAMNASILAELHAIRRLRSPAGAVASPEGEALSEIGVRPESLAEFLRLTSHYFVSRDPGQAIRLLTGAMRERARRYLARWQRWGPALKGLAWLASPYLERLFHKIRLEAEATLEERMRCS